MPPQSHSPPITRCLLVATLFTLVFFATVSLSDSFASISYQGSNSSPEGEAPEPALEKRLLGLGGVVGLVPSLLGNIVPGGIVSSLVAQVTADINSLLPILDEPSAKNPDGMPLLTGAQAALSLTAQPLPTAAQLGGLADKLGGILNGIVPVAAPSIIAAITEQALGVVASVEAIATDVASLGNQIGSGPMQGSDALGQIGGLLGSLDAKVNDIVNGVTSNLGSDLPLSVLQDIGQVISSGLGDIVGAANGPLSLVGDLIEHDVCGAVTTVDGVLATVAGLCGDIPSAVAQVSSELATATLINPDAVLTGDTSAITIFPTSPGITTAPAITAVSTLPSSNSQDQSIPANPPNGSTGGSGSNLTGNGATPSPSNQSSLSNIGSGPSLSSTQASPAQPSVTSKAPGSSGGGSFTIASSLSTFGSPSPEPASVPNTALTSSPSMAGPAQPGVGGTSQTTTTGANGLVTVTEYQITIQQCASGTMRTGQTVTVTVDRPCPGIACPSNPQATCHCPNASPTPPGGNGAKGPCPGTGYTCDDCLDGWFCPPSQTPAQPAPCGFGWPCAHCEGGWFCAPPQTPGPCGSSSAPTASPTTPGNPAPSQPVPPPPEKVTGWKYCGCWADDLKQRALGTETFTLDLLTNEACIQHCIIRGFLMAGTENGDSCLCGNFLNGTQQMEESVCSMSCSGDATQMCGGLNALSCYNPDGEPYGWASAGPQLRTPTMSPPEVAGLDIGGVAHTQITTPAIIFPAGNVDVGNLISKYGKTTRQPLGDFPRDLTFSSPPSSQSISTPFDGGAAAPGRGPTPSVPGDSGSSAGPSITPGASNTLSSPGNPNNPTASVTLNSSDTPSTPDQGAPPTSSNNRGLSTTPPGGNSPAGSNSSPASNNPGSGTTTTSLNNPSTNAPSPSTSSTSTPNSVGGAAPGQGQSPSAPPGESPSSAPSGGSTTSPTTVSISTTSASISPTESSSPGPETTASSASVPSGSILCIPGKDANCTPTSGSSGSKSCVPGADINCGPTPSNSNANPSSSPGQSQGSTTMPTCPPGGNANNPSTTPGQAPGTTLPSGGESPPGLSPPSSGGSSISIPSSSPPLSGGWVAPHSQISTTSLPGGSSIACTPGSSESACISPTSGGSPPPQPTTSSPNTNSPACSPGSKDPACTSPVGGGIPPGNGQPSTSTPDSIPGSCTAGSTDPACTSPNGGGNVAPGQNQPTSATNPPGAPSESTTFISNSITSGSTIGSTPSGHSGPNSKTTLPSPESNSLTTTNQESPPPPGLSESTQVSSSTLSGSGSTPNGFGGVAPGGQSPTTSSAVSSGQTPVTASVPPEGSSGSVIPTETSSKPPTSNKQTSSPNVPGHSNPPNPAGTGPQTSYTYPPGLVPYGGSSPVMTTLASMLAWREPDGVAGAPTMLHPATIHNDSDLPQELPALEFEEAPTTATRFSQPADPRWQRIRPVYVW